MIKYIDDIEVGATISVTHWLWVPSYPFCSPDVTRGIGGLCASGMMERAKIMEEVADKDVAKFLNSKITGGFSGLVVKNKVDRCFVCRMLTGIDGGTGAGIGHKFYLSYGAIVAYLNEKEAKEKLFEKLKDIKYK